MILTAVRADAARGLRFGEVTVTSNLRTGRVYGLYLRFLLYGVLFGIVSAIATPIVLMGYYNPIYVYGVERFLVDAKAAGVDAESRRRMLDAGAELLANSCGMCAGYGEHLLPHDAEHEELVSTAYKDFERLVQPTVAALSTASSASTSLSAQAPASSAGVKGSLASAAASSTRRTASGWRRYSGVISSWGTNSSRSARAWASRTSARTASLPMN